MGEKPKKADTVEMTFDGESLPNMFAENVREYIHNLSNHILFVSSQAVVTKAKYDALIKAGFTDKQAIELCKG